MTKQEFIDKLKELQEQASKVKGVRGIITVHTIEEVLRYAKQLDE